MRNLTVAACMQTASILTPVHPNMLSALQVFKFYMHAQHILATAIKPTQRDLAYKVLAKIRAMSDQLTDHDFLQQGLPMLRYRGL